MSLSVLRRAAVARSASAATQKSLVATTASVPVRRSYATQQNEEATQQKEDDPQLNGYPDPADISRAHLPATGWFDNLTRRNYGETVHPREEIVSMWGPDAPVIDPHTALRRLLAVAAGFVVVGLSIKAAVPDPRFVRREYPFDGLVKELGGLEENKARIEAVDTDN